MLCHDPSGTNLASSDFRISPPFEERWHYFVPDDVCVEYLTLSDGILLLSEGGVFNRLEALSASTGQLLWRFDIEGAHGAMGFCPAVWENTVYVSGQGASTLFALELKTGKIKWKFSPSAIGYAGFYEAQPRVLNGILYITANVSPSYDEYLALLKAGVHIPEEPRSKLYALDARSGEERWSVLLNSLSSEQTPCVSAGLVFVYEMYGWNTAFLNDWDTADFGDLVALEALTGKEVWRKKRYATVFNRPLVSDGTLVSLASRTPCVVRAVSLSGTELWDYSTSSTALPGFAASSGTLCLTLWEEAKNDEVVAIDLHTGQKLWAFRSQGEHLSPPTLAGRILLAATPSRLLALDINTGELLWSSPKFPIKSLAVCQPIVADDSVFAAFGNQVLSFGPPGHSETVHPTRFEPGVWALVVFALSALFLILLHYKGK